MKVGIWGAGDIGNGLAYRLVTTSVVSELYWINRTISKIRSRVMDIEQGLALSPSCWKARAVPQHLVRRIRDRLDALVLTAGAPVKPGQARADTYPSNQALFRDSILELLVGFQGIVIVITNPVDLMARLVFKEAGLSQEKVIGLGTIVETARLRAAIGGYLDPERPAREVSSYAIGTHDEKFIVAGEIGAGARLEPDLIDSARESVVKAASRVKEAQKGLKDKDRRSTLFPVVEGIIAILRAIKLDSKALLTVSVREPDSPDDLFFSVPVTIGRAGLIHRHTELLNVPEVAAGIERCRESMRALIRAHPDR